MTLEIWNKIEKVADHLGVKKGTQRQWKSRGNVPAKWHFSLSQSAKKVGEKISIEDLHAINSAGASVTKRSIG